MKSELLHVVAVFAAAILLSGCDEIIESELSENSQDHPDEAVLFVEAYPNCTAFFDTSEFVSVESLVISYPNCVENHNNILNGPPPSNVSSDLVTGIKVQNQNFNTGSLHFFTSLKYLSINAAKLSSERSNSQSFNLFPLAGMASLENLEISVREISDSHALDPISSLHQLKFLKILSWQFSTIGAIRNLDNLERLEIRNGCCESGGLETLNDLSGLDSLKVLSLASIRNLTNISGVQNLRRLESLDISETNVANISALRKLTNLRFLNLETTPVSNIRALRNMTKLEHLMLSATQVTSLSPLRGMINLTRLEIGGVPFDSLEPLSELHNLETLYVGNLQHEARLIDFTPILNLPNLKTIYVEYNDISPEQRRFFEKRGVRVGSSMEFYGME